MSILPLPDDVCNLESKVFRLIDYIGRPCPTNISPAPCFSKLHELLCVLWPDRVFVVAYIRPAPIQDYFRLPVRTLHHRSSEEPVPVPEWSPTEPEAISILDDRHPTGKGMVPQVKCLKSSDAITAKKNSRLKRCFPSSQNPQKNRANFPIRPVGFWLDEIQ